MIDKQQLIYKIKHLPYWLFKAKGSGYKHQEIKSEDFKTSMLGWSLFGYSPKNQKLIIPTLSIKNQRNFNNCVYQSMTVSKEVDEQLKLSVRSVCSYAKKKGLLSGNGWSTLEGGQQSLKDWGITETNLFPEDINDWNEYSNIDIDRFKSQAEKHKIQSFWEVDSRDDRLKLLDEGKVLHCAITWFTGFNQGGGFSSPWLITKSLGYSVGGHAIACIGYDLNYKGVKVYVFQNSYGEDWGDNGKFYISMDYFDKYGLGCKANLDIPKENGKFLRDYDGKDVKGKNSPAIYHIQSGKKKPYLHEMDYFVWNSDKDKMEFEIVDDAVLNTVPDGDNMDITKSPYWPILKHLDQPLNITRVLEALKLNK